MSEEINIDDLINKEYSEIEYLNYIKPEVIKKIRDYVISSKSKTPLEDYAIAILKKEKSKKRDIFLEIIIELKSLRKKYKAGEKFAGMCLINYGFLKKRYL
jgi:hypothetical protein